MTTLSNLLRWLCYKSIEICLLKVSLMVPFKYCDTEIRKSGRSWKGSYPTFAIDSFIFFIFEYDMWDGVVSLLTKFRIIWTNIFGVTGQRNANVFYYLRRHARSSSFVYHLGCSHKCSYICRNFIKAITLGSDISAWNSYLYEVRNVDLNLKSKFC